MKLGERMRRLADGREGEVIEFDGALRIRFFDRGEVFIAPKREVWEPVLDPPKGLREEEIFEIAMRADQALRAIERHEVYRFWEKPKGKPFDAALVELISGYLRQRGS